MQPHLVPESRLWLKLDCERCAQALSVTSGSRLPDTSPLYTGHTPLLRYEQGRRFQIYSGTLRWRIN
jgi:hypothetical protein